MPCIKKVTTTTAYENKITLKPNRRHSYTTIVPRFSEI